MVCGADQIQKNRIARSVQSDSVANTKTQCTEHWMHSRARPNKPDIQLIIIFVFKPTIYVDGNRGSFIFFRRLFFFASLLFHNTQITQHRFAKQFCEFRKHEKKKQKFINQVSNPVPFYLILNRLETLHTHTHPRADTLSSRSNFHLSCSKLQDKWIAGEQKKSNFKYFDHRKAINWTDGRRRRQQRWRRRHCTSSTVYCVPNEWLNEQIIMRRQTDMNTRFGLSHNGKYNNNFEFIAHSPHVRCFQSACVPVASSLCSLASPLEVHEYTLHSVWMRQIKSQNVNVK